MNNKLNSFSGRPEDDGHLTGVKVHFETKSRWLKDLNYNIQEQAELYEQCLLDVYNNPRYYLDNLKYMQEFKVSWIDYKTQKITKPYRFCHEKEKLYK